MKTCRRTFPVYMAGDNGLDYAGVDGSTGITIYLPRDARELSNNQPAYARLAIARDFPGWLGFLDRVHDASKHLPGTRPTTRP